jgi:signal transduction histidine kinase
MKFKDGVKKVLELLFTKDTPFSIGTERIILFVRWIIIILLVFLLLLTTNINRNIIWVFFILAAVYNLLLSIIFYSGVRKYPFRVIQYVAVFVDEIMMMAVFVLTGDTNNIVYSVFFFLIFGVSLRMESKDSYIVSSINAVVLPIVLYMFLPESGTMIKAGVLGVASLINIVSTRTLEVNTIRLKREARNTSVMLSISNVVNSVMELEPLLEIVIYEIVNKFSVTAGIIALFDTRRDDFIYIASSGDLDLIGGYVSHSMLDDYIMNRVITEKKYLIMPEQDIITNMTDSWFETLSSTSYILFPFDCNDDYTGIIGLFGRKDNKQFSSYYLTILKGITSQIITGINRAFLYEDLLHNRTILTELLAKIETAHEDERKKIVGELHDIASGVMYELISAVDDILKKTRDSHSIHNEAVQHMKSLIMDSQRQLRLFLTTLRSTVLDDFGLVHALKDLLGNFKQQYNMDVEFISEKNEYLLLPLQKEFFYKFANEALLNVEKHASASKVVVKLYQENTDVIMSVRDNGKGFDTAEKFKNKYGLLYIKERINVFKGKINIKSEAGKGTTITAILPITEA